MSLSLPPTASILIVLAIALAPARMSQAETTPPELASGLKALLAKDDGEAVREFRRAAEKGSAQAQFFLGLLYREGRGVPQDIPQAVEWYRKAAAAGSAEARYNLGYLYEKGVGVAQDNTEAIKWYRSAALSGIAPLADETGSKAKAPVARPQAAAPKRPPSASRGTPEQIPAELDRRAQMGDPEAQYKLGELYEIGKGVPQDPVVGAQWKAMATGKGYRP